MGHSSAAIFVNIYDGDFTNEQGTKVLNSMCKKCEASRMILTLENNLQVSRSHKRDILEFLRKKNEFIEDDLKINGKPYKKP